MNGRKANEKYSANVHLDPPRYIKYYIYVFYLYINTQRKCVNDICVRVEYDPSKTPF